MKQIKDICIFGGGSAGWISALSLSNVYTDLQITLINPVNYNNVGVGESTQPDLVQLLLGAGIDLQDFIVKTDATLKHGIYYKNWRLPNTEYWHPFTDLSDNGEYTRAHHYQKLIQEIPQVFTHDKYYKMVHPSYTLCVENNLCSTDMPFALHVDADKMAIYLREYLKDRITVVDSSEIDIKSNGEEIQSIIADDIEYIADLYIDASGFSRKLISRVSNCEIDEYEGNVNSALFARIPYTEIGKENRFPYTRAEAFSNGWLWTIPLANRVGTGCVYNNQYMSEKDAKDYFVNYWHGKINKEDIRAVNFQSGSLTSPWVSNVVCVGLSAGFIEPLEATGISWFVISADTLTKLLKGRYYDNFTSQRFNSMIRSYIEDVQDFVDVHYMLSDRKDSDFWKYQTIRPRHKRLTTRLESYKLQLPNKGNRNLDFAFAFNDVSWIDILNGYHFSYNTINVPANRNLEIYFNHTGQN